MLEAGKEASESTLLRADAAGGAAAAMPRQPRVPVVPVRKVLLKTFCFLPTHCSTQVRKEVWETEGNGKVSDGKSVSRENFGNGKSASTDQRFPERSRPRASLLLNGSACERIAKVEPRRFDVKSRQSQRPPCGIQSPPGSGVLRLVRLRGSLAGYPPSSLGGQLGPPPPVPVGFSQPALRFLPSCPIIFLFFFFQHKRHVRQKH